MGGEDNTREGGREGGRERREGEGGGRKGGRERREGGTEGGREGGKEGGGLGKERRGEEGREGRKRGEEGREDEGGGEQVQKPQSLQSRKEMELLWDWVTMETERVMPLRTSPASPHLPPQQRTGTDERGMSTLHILHVYIHSSRFPMSVYYSGMSCMYMHMYSLPLPHPLPFPLPHPLPLPFPLPLPLLFPLSLPLSLSLSLPLPLSLSFSLSLFSLSLSLSPYQLLNTGIPNIGQVRNTSLTTHNVPTHKRAVGE